MIFRKTGLHPGSSPGRAFSGSCSRLPTAVPRGRPLTGAFAGGRAPHTAAAVADETSDAACRAATLGNRDPDRTARSDGAGDTIASVLADHMATDDTHAVAERAAAIAAERV